jgi:hypothetical protein
MEGAVVAEKTTSKKGQPPICAAGYLHMHAAGSLANKEPVL